MYLTFLIIFFVSHLISCELTSFFSYPFDKRIRIIERLSLFYRHIEK